MKHLKYFRNKKGLFQKDIAQMLGIDRTTYVKYETGASEPDLNTIKQLADFYGVAIDTLINGENGSPINNAVRVPVYGHVAAGIPLDAIEDILDYEEMSADDAREGEYFALKIKGRSMEPRIYDGDVVIIRRQPDVNNGEIAIVLINGDEATCKKIKKTPKGVMLISLNPDFEPMFYSNEEILELPVVILGKVEEVRGKLKRI